MPLYRWDDLNGYRTRTPGAGAPAPQAPAAPAPAPSSGGYVYSPDGTVSATGGWSANKGAADALGKASTAVGLVGLATQNPNLQQVGGVLGLGANLAGAKDATEAGIAVGRYGAAQLGVPSYVSAPVLGGLQGYAREGTREGAAWGAAGAAAGALTGKAAGALIGGPIGLLGGAVIGGMASRAVGDYRLGSEVDPNASVLGQHALGRAINNDEDKIGALINALSPAVDRKADEDETELGAAKAASATATAATPVMDALTSQAQARAEAQAAAEAYAGSAYSSMGSEAFGSAGWSSAVNSYSDTRAAREGRNEGSYDGGGYSSTDSDGQGSTTSAGSGNHSDGYGGHAEGL